MDRNGDMQEITKKDEMYGRFELATAYVPYQQWGELYPPGEALAKGTIFPALYRPYREE
ncbi:MAG: hypothetical protein HPY66_1294 [Firmicutes bacterium]|nr:hypothetical protein [Bacillota bacterium]MDI6706689.1 spore coat associated protein CotJA [Bacillota bacterium]